MPSTAACTPCLRSKLPPKNCGFLMDKEERWAIRLSLRSRAADGKETLATQGLPPHRTCRWGGLPSEGSALRYLPEYTFSSLRAPAQVNCTPKVGRRPTEGVHYFGKVQQGTTNRGNPVSFGWQTTKDNCKRTRKRPVFWRDDEQHHRIESKDVSGNLMATTNVYFPNSTNFQVWEIVLYLQQEGQR